MTYFTQFLNATHDRAAFCSGNEMLDNYLKTQVNQDINRKLSTCFILFDAVHDSTIKGYYTLSNGSIPLDLVPENIQKKLPKSYRSVPTTLLGRLAVDRHYQGQGNGRILLVDALKRSYEISKIIGSFAVVTDPIDYAAEEFYKKYGFIKLPDSGKMFLTTKLIDQLFGE